MSWLDDLYAPCGTAAGAVRHWRAGESPCGPCRTARDSGIAWEPSSSRVDPPDRSNKPDHRERRNGLPGFRPYIYRGTGEDVLTGHLSDAELEMAGAS